MQLSVAGAILPAVVRDHRSRMSKLIYDKQSLQQTVSSEEDAGSFDGQQQQHTPPANSPWQRMKWTDSMVRLLITVVYHVGDDQEVEQQSLPAAHGKKTASSSSPATQKKGKWKSASRAMMEKGFFVSPQQCEDKFNDLNKRYKRVIDLLGKGLACGVVENPSLLDSMDYLSTKSKQEARKLLSSKHLFFPEMCAYHNPEALQSGSAHCLHHHGRKIPSPDAAGNGNKSEEDGDDEEEDADELEKGKSNGGWFFPSMNVEQLREEVMSIGGGIEEQREWVKRKGEEMEEKKVGFARKGYKLERQRFKWQRFSASKEREMQRMKLENDRRRLENDRMLLILKRKEMELKDCHHNIS